MTARYAWSTAAERNQAPLLEQLQCLLDESRAWRVLEIGSGTGQHAAHFARHLPHVIWQTSDLSLNLASINAYLDTVTLPNVVRPIELDADTLGAFGQHVDMIYTANTLHIMSWRNVLALLQNSAKVLAPRGRLVMYGPFHVGGQPTSEGNYRFDQTLSQTNAWQGIRDREAVIQAADAVGFSLTYRADLPANNQLLVLERRR